MTKGTGKPVLPRRIAVTGASGNVGTALLRRLAAESEPPAVRGVVRRVPTADEPYAGVEWVSADLAEKGSADHLRAAFDGVDAVVHLAWLIQPGRDRELLRRANQDGSRRVIEAARSAGVAQLVHLSSIGTYAPAAHGRRVDESWPATGVPTSSYSMDKAAVEELLDDATGIDTITRLRPGLILQGDSGAEIARYFLGRLVPSRLIRPGLLRVAPWPSAIATQVVHADDVADAIVRVLARRSAGAFNLAAEPVVDRAGLRAAFGTRAPSTPIGLLRAAANLSWRLRLQPTNPGWIDLAAGVPLLDCTRAQTELGWRPEHSSAEVLTELLGGIGAGSGAASAPLRPRAE